MEAKTFELLLPEGLFFVRKNLEGLDEESLVGLFNKIYVPGDYQQRVNNIHYVIGLLHAAHDKNPKEFLTTVFFPWVALKRKTANHKTRIFEEMSNSGDYELESNENATHLVNIYRNSIADLFDPYISLIVACYQFIEGTFVDMENANLSQGERNKVEYIQSRLRQEWGEPNILSGYDPVVRNAISHSGSSGVTYREGEVVFRNIQRGPTPTAQTVVWPHHELEARILALAECIVSIDVSEEIFGLDVTEVIQRSPKEDFDILSQFAWHVLSKEQRSTLNSWGDEKGRQVRESDEISLNEKLDALGKILFKNCALRGMTISSIAFRFDVKTTYLSVPPKVIDTTDEQSLVGRCQELMRYAIIARSIFLDLMDTFVIDEIDEKETRQLSAVVQGVLLDEYIAEEAGLYDLLNDSEFFLGSERFYIRVDFEVLKSIENRLPEDPFPRKKR